MMPIEDSTAPTESAIDVVYVDEAIVVLDKPAGLLSVPGRGPDKQDCLSARVQVQFANALVVHRLDMSTSGLIVMARGLAVQRALGDAFANRTVTKRYEAVVYGEVPHTEMDGRVIDLPIAVDWPNRPLRVINHATGKPSITRLYQRHFDVRRNVSHVLLEPLTGRTHQLRLHLQAIGHPILGDALYAPPEVAALAARLMLHACELGFAHPVNGVSMQFSRRHLTSA